eukprot:GILJ01013865.1.p1 GENE.GILJ01013865.1~~GILJ01013865.1.p1  ORF type:complete len:1655 (+),score=404.74 GILJ01013865.1:682-4965(+)
MTNKTSQAHQLLQVQFSDQERVLNQCRLEKESLSGQLATALEQVKLADERRNLTVSEKDRLTLLLEKKCEQLTQQLRENEIKLNHTEQALVAAKQFELTNVELTSRVNQLQHELERTQRAAEETMRLHTSTKRADDLALRRKEEEVNQVRLDLNQIRAKIIEEISSSNQSLMMSLQSLLDEQRETNLELKQNVNETKSQLIQVENERNTLRRQVDELQGVGSHLNQVLQDKSRLEHELTERSALFVAREASFNAESKRFEADLDRATQRIYEADRKLVQEQAERESIQQALNSKQNQLTQVLSQAQTLKTLLDRAEAETAQVREENARWTARVEELSEQFVRVDQERNLDHQSIQHQIAQLTRSEADSRKQLEQKRRDEIAKIEELQSTHREQLTELKKQLDSETKRSQELLNESETVKSLLRKAESDRKLLRVNSELASHEQIRNQEMTIQIRQLSAELEKNQIKESMLREEYERCQQDLLESTSQVKSLHSAQALSHEQQTLQQRAVHNLVQEWSLKMFGIYGSTRDLVQSRIGQYAVKLTKLEHTVSYVDSKIAGRLSGQRARRRKWKDHARQLESIVKEKQITLEQMNQQMNEIKSDLAQRDKEATKTRQALINAESMIGQLQVAIESRSREEEQLRSENASIAHQLSLSIQTRGHAEQETLTTVALPLMTVSSSLESVKSDIELLVLRHNIVTQEQESMNQRLRDELKQTENRLMSLEDEITRVESCRLEAVNRFRVCESQVSAVEQEKRDVEGELTQTKQELSRVINEHTQTLDQLRRSEGESKQLRTQLISFQQDLESVKIDSQRMENEHRTSQAQLLEANQAKDELTCQIKILQLENEAKQETVTRVSSELESNQKSLQDVVRAKNDVESKLNVLEEQKLQLETQLSYDAADLSQELERLRESLAHESQLRREKESELTRLEKKLADDIKEYAIQIEELEGHLGNATERLRAAAKEKEQSRIKYDSIKEQYDLTVFQLDEASSEIESLKSELTRMQTNHTTLIAARDKDRLSWQREVQEADREIESLQSLHNDLTRLTEERDELKRELKSESMKANEQIKRLTDELSQNQQIYKESRARLEAELALRHEAYSKANQELEQLRHERDLIRLTSEQEMNRLNRQLSTHELDSRQLTSTTVEKEQLQRQLAETERERDRFKRELELLEKANQQLTREKESLRQSAMDHLNERNNNRESEYKARVEVAEEVKRLESSRKLDHIFYTDKITQLTGQVDESDRTIQHLTQQLNQYEMGTASRLEQTRQIQAKSDWLVADIQRSVSESSQLGTTSPTASPSRIPKRMGSRVASIGSMLSRSSSSRLRLDSPETSFSQRQTFERLSVTDLGAVIQLGSESIPSPHKIHETISSSSSSSIRSPGSSAGSRSDSPLSWSGSPSRASVRRPSSSKNRTKPKSLEDSLRRS